MDKIIVKGGNTRLSGEVVIEGAKNSVLPLLAATILASEGQTTLTNVPILSDVYTMNNVVRGLDIAVDFDEENNTVVVDASGEILDQAPYEYVSKMRASIVVLGPILARNGHAKVSMPGGCTIGSRPIDLHLKGLEAMGAKIIQVGGDITATAEKLKGATIYMDFPSVGATQNLMMAATLADGVTTIENAAREPEIVDLAILLNEMGANVKGAGTEKLVIKGVKSLHGTQHAVIQDRIEAGTFMFAAAATKGDVTVKNVIPKHLEAISAKLLEIGCEVEEFDDAVRVVSSKPLHHTQVTTLPYPGFPTDMQPQIAVVLGISEGTSTVTESIFENRFKYVGELARMGANFKVESNIAIIGGIENYTGARVNAPDLRAGAALVIAGLAAEGITVVDDIYYIERGYEEFEKKLASLGAVIEKVSTEKEIQKFTLKVS